MIYVTGDTHANLQPQIERCAAKLTRDDTLIICGDFGFLWYLDKLLYPEQVALQEDKLEYMAMLPFKILFLDGNHENFDYLNVFDTIKWAGGKVHLIEHNILHLQRGYVYNIEGKSIFAYGGATSIDKWARREGISWWEQEIPSEKEFERAKRNLKKVDGKVDYVFTHCLPTTMMRRFYPTYREDAVTKQLEKLTSHIHSYKSWYCGHYHENRTIDNINVLFDSVVPLV